ncbi:MAG: VWA domain-containing protein [Thermodesulfobacteriota bacterium]|nr:VWA domain-containing protein [Thermodesulfobacteriota bacterium]
MKQKYVKTFFLIVSLIAVTGAVMVYSSNGNPIAAGTKPGNPGENGIVTITGSLTQDKVLVGEDGIVTLSLNMHADEVIKPDNGDIRNVDIVIVLDRSGSMQGAKIRDAKAAVLNLLSNLSAKDRFALVSYSDSVQKNCDMIKVTGDNREQLEAAIKRISANGGTNLGAGLQTGINVLMSAARNGNAGKIILISDGLANQGVTDPASLGSMASIATEKDFAVSTVGVGADFNEILMTLLADKGTGNYYYLENPDAFAEVFQKEFLNSRAAVATSMEVRIPLSEGVSLLNAAGYPIKVKNNHAVFYPGEFRSGQTRKLFLTLRVPTNKERKYELDNINVRYLHNGSPCIAKLSESFQIACVKNQKEVVASIDKEEWEEKVLKHDYNRLKEEVAIDIKKGNEKNAINRIERYCSEQQALNLSIGSGKVAENLDKDIDELTGFVRQTFKGKPEDVFQKQKKNSKSLQYDGYMGIRQSN